MKRYSRAGLAVLFFLGILFCASVPGQGATGGFYAEDVFSEANSLYRHNQYDAAIAEYEKILEHGLESGNLYYNLGNCYFKKGEFGRAILNYERAEFFIPADSDLRSNEEYARSLLNLGNEGLPGNWLERNLDKAFAGISPNPLALILSLIYLLILVSIALRLVLGRMRFFKGLLAGMVLVFLVSAAALYRKVELLNHGAVVTAKEIEARFEPLENATTYFTLTEGAKVLVVDSSGNWLKIRRPDNKVGWAERAAISLI